MGYELMVLDESSPAIYDDMASSLSTVNNHFDDIYDNVRMINDASSSMFDGINKINFLGMKNIINMQGDIKSETEKNAEKMGKMYEKANKVVGAFINMKVAAKGVSSAIDYSENLMSMQNGISAVNDGSQSDIELRNKVYGASMRSRTDMGTTMTTVSGLSDAGFSNDEAIQYTENLNKMFAISGVSESAQAGAAQALVQSLSDGVVSGEELNSVLNAAPEIVNEMAENMGIPLENLQQMAEQGQLSADIMKNSMLGATGSINAEFANTKANWSQTMGNIKNVAMVAFEPLGNKINEIINSPSFSTFITDLGDAMSIVSNVLSDALDIVSSIGGFMADNWDIVQPVLFSVIVLLGMILIASLGVYKVQQFMTTATKLFNAAWAVCPVVLVILAIIAVFYIVIGLINHFAGTSLSATGIIAGAFMTVVAVIWNLILALADYILGTIGYLVNPLINFANFFSNLFTDPVASVINLFRDLAINVLNVLKTMASAIDKIFGSNLTGTIDGWIDNANNFADKAVEKFGNGKYEKKFEEFNVTTESLGLKRMGYKDSYNSGYDFGEGLTDFSMPDMKSGLGGLGTGGVDYSKMFEGTGVTEGNIGDINTSALSTQLNTSDISSNTKNLGINTDEIAGNTQNVGNNAESIGGNTLGTYSNTDELVDISKSILSIMQQNMEKESKKENSPNIVVDMRNMNNNISSEVDADDLIKKITSSIVSSANSSADGSGTLFGSLIG